MSMASKCPFHQAKQMAKEQQEKLQQKEEKDECPVIHAVNDDEAEEAGIKYEKASPLDFEEEFEDEIPSMREYKKIKRYMSLITEFYRNGSKLKEEKYKQACADVEKVETDIQMAKEQLADLVSHDSFKGHLKYKDIKEELENDINRLALEKTSITDHQDKMKELSDWGKGIVGICEWLELNLDNYCKQHLDLPQNILKKLKPAPSLTKEQVEKYGKGLDEIMHNLNESRDFFQAAVDGRLDKYYELEKKIIESQLKILRNFPESSGRRQYVESSLQEDLDHAIAQLESSKQTETQKRRQKMLDLHLDFLKVLNFFKSKLGLLKTEVDRLDRKYDSTFTIEFDVSAE